MRAEPASASQGCDCSGDDHWPGHVCTPAWLARVPGIRFVARYLSLRAAPQEVPDDHGGDHAGCYSLSRLEIEWILGAGKALIPVQWGSVGGDVLGPELGYQRGAQAAVQALGLGLPDGAHLWCDFEGARARAAGADACRQYLEAWSMVVCGAGFRAGLYVGDDSVPLHGTALYALPLYTSYWGSVPAKRAEFMRPVPRDWAIRQSPPSTVEGLSVDRDEIVMDGKGETPWWVVA
jgi:hypothetical protein